MMIPVLFYFKLLSLVLVPKARSIAFDLAMDVRHHCIRKPSMVASFQQGDKADDPETDQDQQRRGDGEAFLGPVAPKAGDDQ
mmetsp:Transcript_3158/g.6563  ORF Transcript_3158/g.6563 Transcript_3158/m.6563 type:complete len:82 (-) Transcript_3158:125-370(-)